MEKAEIQQISDFLYDVYEGFVRGMVHHKRIEKGEWKREK
jgi:hypothetical protein